MHNITEAVWKSRLKIIWSTTRQGWGRCGQKRSEKTVATRGYGKWNSRGKSKDRSMKINFLYFLVLLRIKSYFKIFGNV